MTPALTSQPADGRVVVIGLGADGWTGLPVPVQRRLTDASVVLGSERQLALLPPRLLQPLLEWVQKQL